jgi:serine/threonine protein kinase
MGQPTKGARGTEGYIAPEVWDQQTFSKKSDIWSVGCILYKVATTGKESAFLHHDAARWYDRGVKGALPVPQLELDQNPELGRNSNCNSVTAPVWMHLNEILRQCLSPKPADRPAASELLLQFQVAR